MLDCDFCLPANKRPRIGHILEWFKNWIVQCMTAREISRSVIGYPVFDGEPHALDIERLLSRKHCESESVSNRFWDNPWPAPFPCPSRTSPKTAHTADQCKGAKCKGQGRCSLLRFACAENEWSQNLYGSRLGLRLEVSSVLLTRPVTVHCKPQLRDAAARPAGCDLCSSSGTGAELWAWRRQRGETSSMWRRWTPQSHATCGTSSQGVSPTSWRRKSETETLKREFQSVAMILSLAFYFFIFF